MRKKSEILLILIFASFRLWSQCLDQWKVYTSQDYLFSCQELYNENNQEVKKIIDLVKQEALKSLASQIKINIISKSSIDKESINGKTRIKYLSNSNFTTDVSLEFTKTKEFYDLDSKMAYSIAYIDVNDACNYYKLEIKRKGNTIRSIIAQIEKGDIDERAITEKLEKSIKLLDEVSEMEGKLALYRCNSNELDEITESINGLDITINKLSATYYRNRSLEDVIDNISKNFASNITNGFGVFITYPTFQDTEFLSPFSKRVSQLLEHKLTNENIIIVTESTVNSFYIKGTYWEYGSFVKVNLSLVNEKGFIISTAEDKVLKSVLDQNNISYEAENFTEAYIRMQHFKKDELIKGDLNAEIWTNKGVDKLLFKEGEKMNLRVRVNVSSYLRVIYYLADGSKVLLLDNYYIDNSKVNKVVEIPKSFICSSPFGYETLQLTASTKRFEDLTVKRKYGYLFIQEGLAETVTKTRGFKEDKTSKSNISSEIRLNITTHK